MNQEAEQDQGATSSSRVGWPGRRARGDDLSAYEDIEHFNDAASAEDASAASASEYRRGAQPPPPKGAHMGSAGYGGSGAPCGACKFLRRKCAKECVFAPYFGAEHGAARFAAVHKIFGASNVSKLLQSIPLHKRFDAVITISYEAQARITNPVYGCVAHIADLQQQVQSLQAELSYVHAQLANSRQLAAVSCMALQQHQHQQQGAAGPFLPFEPPQPIDPVHMQQLLCHPIPSPPTTASYARVKDEIENPVQGIAQLYDGLPVGTPSTPSLAAGLMQHDPDRFSLAAGHMQHEPERRHHHHHLSLDLTEKNDDPSSFSLS